MLHLRLFDSSFYYALESSGVVSTSSSSAAVSLAASTSTERAFNGSLEGAEGAGGVDDVAAVNLTYITPAISHVILAPTTIPPMVQIPIQTTAAPCHDFDLEAVGNSTCGDNLNSFYFYETQQFITLWFLFFTIVLGNSAVLFVMFIKKNRKSRMNFFIKQLAFADLCVGLINVLTDIVWRSTVAWNAGNLACKLIRFIQTTITYASTYVLVAMSIDRYDAINNPMNFSKSSKRGRRLVAGAWLLAVIFSIPMLYLYEEEVIQGSQQCWIELGSPERWQYYMVAVSFLLFVAPAVIISFCYAIIVKTIWANGSIFLPTERGAAPTRRASSRGIIPRAKVKTVKMTLTIVFVFIICWSPYIVFDLLQVYDYIPHTQSNIALASFVQSLAPLNSAANPLIYCLFSSQVFRTLSRYPPFKWFNCCCKSNRNNSRQNRCNTVGRRLQNSCDSMRTLTTSLTTSRRSANRTNAHVVINERPTMVVPAMSEV
ncbi:cardioacceleratory peptide receptor [Drosophila takahashii]|uniref:cardioacceleratory peptide receptor n=1 Tax=Drosophila takahashii TaxID=29030 RepID=UPI0038995609